jgi:hypothetical protein
MRGIANLQLYQNLTSPFNYQMPPVNQMQAMHQQHMLSNQLNEFQKTMSNLQNIEQTNAQKLLMKQSFIEYNRKMQAAHFMQQPQIRHFHHPHESDMDLATSYNRMAPNNNRIQKSFVTNNGFEATQKIMCRQSLVMQSTRNANETGYEDEQSKPQTDLDIKHDDTADHTTTDSESSIMVNDDATDLLDENDGDSDLYKSYDSISVSSDFDKNPKTPRPKYDFTLNALDLSLYGYLRTMGLKSLGHALTDIKLLPDIINLPASARSDQGPADQPVSDQSKGNYLNKKPFLPY